MLLSDNVLENYKIISLLNSSLLIWLKQNNNLIIKQEIFLKVKNVFTYPKN